MLERPRQAVDAILEAAVRRNAEDDITGVLLAHNGCFLQVLEGPLLKVNRCLNRIARDSRHYDMRLYYEDNADMRVFPHWSMCERSLSNLDAEIAGILDYRGEFDATDLSLKSAFKLLVAISDVHASRFKTLKQLHPVTSGDDVDEKAA